MERAARRRSSRRWIDLRGAILAAPLVATVAAPVAAQVNVDSFDLPPGASVTITFDVIVDNPLAPCASSIQNQGTVSATNHADVLTDDTAVGGGADPTVTPLDAIALAITKTDGAASAVPGTSVTYTIVASNAGPTAATGVTVADDFPAILTGCSTTSVAAGGALGNDTGMIGDFVDTGILLPVGASITYTATCTVDPAATGTLANSATIAQSGSQIECDTTDNSATDTDTLTAQADVSITKTNNVTNVDAGGTTTYVIVASNVGGPSTAAGVTVADSFDFTKLSSCSTTSVATGGATGNDAGPFGGSINDGGISLPVGATVTYTSVCGVLGTATGPLSNTATISTSASDPNGGDNSATDGPDTINPLADLAITKSDGVTTAVPGMSVTYTIVAANAGPATATGATVIDTFPASLTCSWTCVGAGGGTCAAGPVAGDIADSANLPSGGSATYTAVCQIADGATGSLVNTATIGGGGVTDDTPGNNSATDTDALLTLDFGDLADPSYPTLLASDGARHGVVSGFRLGAQIDAEADGQPTADADGDDQIDGPDVDDEDGVALPGFFVACETTDVIVSSPVAGGRLDAWVDWNADGDFDLPAEKAVDNVLLALAGDNVVAVTAPCSALPGSSTFARFRLSTAGNLAPTGVAADGEVEDYPIAIRGADFGDAPAPYPTLLADDGARHVQAPGSQILGSFLDPDADGQPTAGASGDDSNGVDDEDGVTFTSPLFPGQNATVTVVASGATTLNAWIDFDGDGSWAQAGDQIFDDTPLAAGSNNLVFAVPATGSSNLPTVARFRVSSTAGLSFTGLADDGEVEDHAVSTAPVADLSITKTDGSATEIAGTSVTYTIVASNAGPDPITGATVADTFPGILSGVTWTCVGAGGGTCAAGGAGNINDLVNLPAGGSVTYTATGNIDPAATGTLVNTAAVTLPGTAFDPNAANNSATDTDTLTPQTDLSITKTDGAETQIPGTPVTYTIAVSNTGPSTATGVSLDDTFPASLAGCAWTSLAAGGATGNSPAGAGNISESGITMPPAASITYTVTCNIDPAARGTLVNTATVASATTDPTPGNNSATDTDTLLPEVDLGVVKVESIDPVIAGSGAGNLTYTITLSNAGPSTATLVTMSEALTLPAGVTVVSITPSQGSFVDPTWAAGTIAPAGSATLTVLLTASAAAAAGTDVICDTATVTGAAETIVNPSNDSGTECTSVARQVDMVVSKTESVDPVVAGAGAGNLTYVVTVTNNGPSDASGIALSEIVTVPTGVTVDSATPSQGSFVSPIWTVGSLTSGASATLTVVLTASAVAAPGTDVICDTATLTAVNEPQVVIGSETDTECTSIIVSADLSITKIDDADPPPAGADLTYTIAVTNNGPSNATAVVVTDPLPAATTYVSDTCGASNVPPWTWNIGSLAAGASVSCDVVVSINPTPPGSISNTATVTATTSDAVPGNNSDTEDTTLDAVPPTVENVESQGGSGDGTLADCETVSATVWRLAVDFSEGMNDPPGDVDADDVTNPANYLLVVPGPDFDFQTSGCGGAVSDDVAVAISAVTYDESLARATLELAGQLQAAQYRLFACDELTDLAGNPLDGDGDSSAGGDFLRFFRADPGNLFANGHFDCDLEGWNETAADPLEVEWTGAEDADGADGSGSAQITNLAPGVDTTFALDQCYPIPAAAALVADYRVRLDAATGVLVGFSRSCTFFSAAGCGTPIGSNNSSLVLSDSGGAWIPFSHPVSVPAGAQSGRCTFGFSTAAGASFDGFLDAAVLRAPGEIFADGFESGDASAWAATVP